MTRDPLDLRPTETRDGTGQAARRPASIGLLAIIVVNFGSHGLIEANLGGVDFGAMPVRIIVVDNYSSDEERSLMLAMAGIRGWTFLALDTNRGFGAAVNEGVRQARTLGCASVLLLNPDAAATPEVVAELHAASLRDPDSMICPRIVDSGGRDFFAGSRVSLRDGSIRNLTHDRVTLTSRDRRIPWLTAACLATTCELFERIGGFDESYFLYWEDVDLSHRAHLVGATLTVREDLVVVHDEGGTQGNRRGRAKSDLYYYYNCRNRLAFAASNLARRDLCRWILSTPAASWRILMRGGRRQLLHSSRPLVATILGTCSGLRIAIRTLVHEPTTRVPRQR